jgi:hypothetical protein
VSVGVASSFWRAAGYCLHPRVVFTSLAPVVLAGVLVFAFAVWAWLPAVELVRGAIDAWPPARSAFVWLDSVGAGGLRLLLAPLLIVAVAIPLLVVLTLLLVAALMTPAIVELVARRRFATLERRRAAGPWLTALWALLFACVALLLTLLTLPLWLLPPLALVLPALLWGWLAYRVFSFEALAGHASADERRRVLAEHRGALLAIGIVSGAMGAVPTLLLFVSVTPWALALAPLLLGLAVWGYTLVFAFAAAWFAHYALAALQDLRERQAREAAPPAPPVGTGAAPRDAPGRLGSDVIDVEARPLPGPPSAGQAPR